MKKLNKSFVLIIFLLICMVFKVDAAPKTYATCNAGANHCLDSTSDVRWIEQGTSTYYILPKAVTYNGSKYTFKDNGTPHFNCKPESSKLTVTTDTSDCNGSGSAGKLYWCNVRYNVSCSAVATTTTTTTTRAKTTQQTQAPTAAPTQKTGSGVTKTKKTNPVTEAPTVPTTEIITEPVTEPPSDNTNIKLILINKKSISYKSSKDEYKFTIAYGIKEVSVDVELEDPKATYKVEGNTDFDDEKTVEDIIITVTAENGEATKVITIKAEKFKPSETDCTLANIYIKDYSINYEKNTFEYTVTLGKDVNSLDIETIKQYDLQMVNVTGNEKLKNKSKIIVEVESPAGDICKYEIKVKKNTSVLKYFIIILVLLIALGIAGYFLYRYINKSNGLYKYE